MTQKTLIVMLSVVAAVFATVLSVRAGDLNPPVGPVAPTQRTPINANMTPGDADSLFKITQPGSYYLTGNITGVVSKHGVEIAASGVTVNLNGFDLLGVAGSLDGVSVTVAGLTNIAVVNGSVRDWGGDGVDLGTFSPTNCRVADVLAGGNSGRGISIGAGSTASNCSAYSNTGFGISTGNGSTVSNCSAYQNGFNGIATSSGCTVTNCSAYLNDGTGISANSGCTFTHCSANNNASHGISASTGNTVAGCTARGNTFDGILCTNTCVIRGNTCEVNGNGGDGAGIHAFGTDNRIEGNNCTGADRGIDMDAAGNIIIKNTCAGNTTDWVIVANNVVGPILDRRAPASAAINGFSAPDSTGSTHPNANFSY